MLKKAALLSVLLGTISSPAYAWRLTGITIGAVTNYNVTHTPTHFVEADTWANTWASDGATYSISDDNFSGWDGAATGGYGASVALLSNLSPPITPSSVIGSVESPMPALGPFATNGDTDQTGPPQTGATYKGFGLMSIAGTLYGFFGRQPEYLSPPQYYTDEYTTQIISCLVSSGCTTASNWTPLPGTTNFPFASPMWPLPSNPRVAADGRNLGLFTTPVWVQYGKDYNNASGTLGGFSLNVDGNTTYAYAFGGDGYSFNASNDYLGRVPIAGGATTIQDPTQWQYYCGPVGGAIATSGNWCGPSSISNFAAITATPLISEPFKVGEMGVQYLPVHGVYVGITTYYPASNTLAVNTTTNTVSEVYQAPTLTGPWTKVQTIVWNPQGIYTPFFVPNSIDADGGLTGYMLMAGDYLHPSTVAGQYTLQIAPVTFNYANP